MGAKREEREKRVYLGQRTIRRTLTCIYVTMLVISITSTLFGLYILIDHHVDQTVKISEIKGLQIRAVTLALLQSNDMNVLASNTWADAKIMSGIVQNPDQVLNP